MERGGIIDLGGLGIVTAKAWRGTRKDTHDLQDNNRFQIKIRKGGV